MYSIKNRFFTDQTPLQNHKFSLLISSCKSHRLHY